MAGVSNSQGLGQIDMNHIRMQSAHDPLSTARSFDNVFNKVSYGLGLMAPALTSGLQAGGVLGNKGSAITTSALMGFAGGGGGISTPGMSPMSGGAPKFNSWGAASGTSAKFLGGGIPLGDAPGYPGGGGGGVGAPPGFPGGGGGGMPGMIPGGGTQDVSQFDSQINAMFQNNMVFLALQQKVQNVSQLTQMASNTAKADSDAKLNAIRNVRA